MMKRLIGAAALGALAVQAQAATPLPDADPAMWVVKDEDTTIYMLGTFHMLDGKRDWFNDEVKTAFDASNEVVLEAILPDNMADLQPLILKYAVDPAGKTLSQKLPKEMKTKLDAQLSAASIPAQAFEPLEPWFVSMTLTALGAQKLGLKPEFGPETILKKAAKEKGMPVGELEGVEMQLSFFDKMPEAAQVAGVGQTLDSLGKLDQTFTPMVDAWSTGNTDKLVSLMNEGMDKEPDLYRILFTDRNAKWADWVQQRMEKPGTVFLAVGAGHLAGKDSVQSFLAKKGIKSERVTN